jgi:hypothetical protein
MKRLILFISIVCGAVTFSGCDSENAFGCFKKPGEIIEQEIQLGSFAIIKAFDEVDIYLVNSSEQRVFIKAGKNLIPQIHLTVEDGILSITNDNSCNWVRSPENPGVYIFSNNISGIEIFDFANIYSEETLVLDNLSIFSDGTGNFDLNIDLDTLFVKSAYISNFTFSGNVDFLDLIITADSRFLARDLSAIDILIDHNGSNRVELYPVNKLEGIIQSTGSVYYFNEPEILDVTVKSTGQLIYLSD